MVSLIYFGHSTLLKLSCWYIVSVKCREIHLVRMQTVHKHCSSSSGYSKVVQHSLNGLWINTGGSKCGWNIVHIRVHIQLQICRFFSVFRGSGFLSSMCLFVPAASYDTNKARQQKLSKETLCQQHPQATMMGISGVKRTKVYTFSERATKGFSRNLISRCDPVWISFNLMYLARRSLFV